MNECNILIDDGSAAVIWLFSFAALVLAPHVVAVMDNTSSSFCDDADFAIFTASLSKSYVEN